MSWWTRGFTHAAAIAYYAIVSMFPLLLLFIVIIGFLLRRTQPTKLSAWRGHTFLQGSAVGQRQCRRLSSKEESRSQL